MSARSQQAKETKVKVKGDPQEQGSFYASIFLAAVIGFTLGFVALWGGRDRFEVGPLRFFLGQYLTAGAVAAALGGVLGAALHRRSGKT